MTNCKKDNDDAKPLKPEDYPKSGNDYTEAAMIRFLCESYENKPHNYKTTAQPGGPGTPTKGTPAWYSLDSTTGKWFWYGGGSLLIVGILVAVFWTNLMNWWNGSDDAESDEVNE